MTPITDIFGKQLLPMMEFVGWFRTEEGIECLNINANKKGTSIDGTMVYLIDKYYDFISQPLEEKHFVRPDKPIIENYEVLIWTGGAVQEPSHSEFDEDSYNEDLKAYEHWQPLFKGEWEFDVGYIGFGDRSLGHIKDYNTINDFATHCFKNNIPLELNEKFEI